MSVSISFSSTISPETACDTLITVARSRCSTGVADRARRAGHGLFRPEVRIHLLELPHLAVGAPAQIAVAGVPQIEIRDLVETARPVEVGSAFVGERLIVDKAVVARRADGLFVESLGIELATFDARNLGADQRGAVLEILRAILRPDLKLPVMRGESVDVSPLARRRTSQAAAATVRRRSDIPPPQTVRTIVQSSRCAFDAASMRLHSRRRRTRLQFADPIPTLGDRQDRVARTNGVRSETRRTARRQASRIRSQAAQRRIERELRGDDVNDQAEPRLLREREATLGFRCTSERIARRKKIRVQIVAAVRCKREIANLVRRFERAAHQITASSDMFRPGHDEDCEDQVGPRLEALQPTSLDKVVAELAKSKSGLVVAEKRSGDQPSKT